MTRSPPDPSESVRRFWTGIALVTCAIRDRDGLSQAEVARRAGVGPRLVSDIEHARANPTSVRLDKLAHGLGLRGVGHLAALALEAVDQITAATVRATD